MSIEENLNKNWGVYQIQQRSHEDVYQSKQIGHLKYYAIFDGHGGSHKLHQEDHIANYARNNLHLILADIFNQYGSKDDITICTAIMNNFIQFDRDMYNNDKRYGTTCCCLIINSVKNKAYQINLGDSRCIISVDGKMIFATEDHDPINEIERDRVMAAGGIVLFGRIQGQLLLSRAFGDFELKSNKTKNLDYDPVNGMVSSVPDVTIIPLQPNMSFILTSDAPFEDSKITNEYLVEMMNSYLSESISYEEVSKKMVKSIESRTTDDITIMVGAI